MRNDEEQRGETISNTKLPLHSFFDFISRDMMKKKTSIKMTKMSSTRKFSMKRYEYLSYRGFFVFFSFFLNFPSFLDF